MPGKRKSYAATPEKHSSTKRPMPTANNTAASEATIQNITARKPLGNQCHKTSTLLATICVSRLSKNKGPERAARCLENNQTLYRKHVEHIQPSMNLELNSPAEFKSILFNGVSSNTNMSTRRGKTFTEFTAYLDKHACSTVDNAVVAIIFSGEDSFFTNIIGIRDYFNKYKHLNIIFYMYNGGNKFNRYPLNDVLQAIDAALSGTKTSSNAQQLISDWVRISTNKMAMGDAKRSNNQIFSRYRNRVDDEEEPAPKQKVVYIYYTEEAKRQRRSESMLQQAARNQKGSGSNSASDGHEHEVETQLDFPCRFAECDMTFSTFSVMLRHIKKVHDPNYQLRCECGREFALESTFSKHRQDNCPAMRADPNVPQYIHVCPQCDAHLLNYRALEEHRTIFHKQRGDITESAQGIAAL